MEDIFSKYSTMHDFQHGVMGKGSAGLTWCDVGSFAWHGRAWQGGRQGKAGMFVGVRYELLLTCIVWIGT